MELLSINPYVRFARVHNKPILRDTVVGCDHRIFFCVGGRGEITAGGTPFAIYPDTFLFIRAGIPYKNTSKTDDTVFFAYNFDLVCKAENMGAPIPYIKADAFCKSDLIEREDCEFLPDVLYLTNFYKKEIFREIIDEYNRKRAYYNERCGALIKDILICAVRSKNEAVQSGKADAVLAYIREHYNEPLTNEAVAKCFSYHKNHLSHLIKEHTGKTLHQYLLSYRMRIAIPLLQSGEYTVTEVAARVGFYDIFHFSKCFKKITGKPPSFYIPKTDRQ